MSKNTTREDRKGASHIIPEKIEIEQGCPTLTEQAHNQNIEFYTRHLKASAKNAKKGSEIFQRLLDDMYVCTDKKNMGKIEKVMLENPNFDQSKPESIDNPFFIEVKRHKYDPYRYKESNVITVAKDAMSDSKEYIKQVQQFEKEARIAERKAKAAIKELEGNTPEKEDTFQPLINLN